MDLIHRTQAAIRPDLPKLMIYGAEWTEERKLRETLEKAGFEGAKIRIDEVEKWWSTEIVMRLMMSEFAAKAKEGWTEEEKGRWAGCARGCLTKGEKEGGMVRMVGWVAVATK